MRISVFGCGYVGLVQAAVLAECGYKVTCVDTDDDKVKQLSLGKVSIYEPHLSSSIVSSVEAKRLNFTSDTERSINTSDIIFIAVGTPSNPDGSANLTYLYQVVDSILNYASSSITLVIKSTVPVGTASLIKRRIKESTKPNSPSISVVSNPEFLKEGSAMQDCRKPDRIIIGSDCDDSFEVMRELYSPFNRNHDKIIEMDNVSAELAKYASNCALASRISFMNEIATIADTVSADIESVRRGVGADPRIGYDFIYAGCGYGGSCFPKDIDALVYSAQQLEVETPILRATKEINLRQKSLLFKKLTSALTSDLKNTTVAIWGGAFKPNTDDIREAPALTLIDELLASGAQVQLYDPKAVNNLQHHYSKHPKSDCLEFFDDKYSVLNKADALVICTEWREFWAADLPYLASTLKQKLIVDGRNLYPMNAVKRAGLRYIGFGRSSV